MAAMMLMDTIILSCHIWDSDSTSFKEMVPIALFPLFQFLPKIPLPTKLLKLVTFHIVTLDKKYFSGGQEAGGRCAGPEWEFK